MIDIVEGKRQRQREHQRGVEDAARPVDLLVTDVVLPGMDGVALAGARGLPGGLQPPQGLLHREAEELGIGIVNLLHIFSPQKVVIGGGVAQIGDLLLQPIRDTVSRRSLQASARTVKINTAVLRRHSSGMGAIVQALSIALHQVAERKEVS